MNDNTASFEFNKAKFLRKQWWLIYDLRCIFSQIRPRKTLSTLRQSNIKNT